MRISDWSSDVCSSDLTVAIGSAGPRQGIAAVASGKLTPIGADASANADGAIPAWTGGLQRAQWPQSFHAGKRLAGPCPDDKPLFVITSQTLEQSSRRLDAGPLALFAKSQIG